MDTNKTEFLKGTIAYVMDSEKTFTKFLKWCEDNQIKINTNVYSQNLIHKVSKQGILYYAFVFNNYVHWCRGIHSDHVTIMSFTSNNEPKTALLSWISSKEDI